MCVPLTTGVTVAPPSSVTPPGVAGWLPTSEIALADPTVEPSAGEEETRRGAVLSMRTPVTMSFDELPRLSQTVARRSYRPSASLLVSYDRLHGELVSVPSAVQVAPPAGVTSKTTLVAPVPVTVAFSATRPEMFAPGLVRTIVGAVTSTSNVTAAPVNVLPARSVITGRKS